MTTRLYYDEPYLTEFGARVVAADSRDGRLEVVLDRTAFYPSSGGQPFDVGHLNGASVLDVVDRDDGTITHVVDQPLPVGSTVVGRVDFVRRFDHMQQHTGQHVLSAAFDRLFGVRTESFHLGTASATIDLAREVAPDEMRAAEDEANRVVWEDRPVSIRVVSAEEAASLPLRKESVRTGPLRLIDIADFDLSACGGTHVARTGAIGIIAIAGWEKFRGGTRVEFLCGRRVLGRFRQWRDALSATMRHLSVQPEELAGSVEKLQQEARALQKTIRAQQERLAHHDAEALLTRAVTHGDRVVLVEAIEGWDAPGLKAMAAAITASQPAAAVVLIGRAVPPVAVVAAGPASRVDASAVLKALTSAFGGRGGGKRDLAQGGGFTAPIDQLIDAAQRALKE